MHLPIFQLLRRVSQKSQGKDWNNVDKSVNTFGKSMNFKKLFALLLIEIKSLQNFVNKNQSIII
jgi:hypothetical protein